MSEAVLLLGQLGIAPRCAHLHAHTHAHTWCTSAHTFSLARSDRGSEKPSPPLIHAFRAAFFLCSAAPLQPLQRRRAANRVLPAPPAVCRSFKQALVLLRGLGRKLARCSLLAARCSLLAARCSWLLLDSSPATPVFPASRPDAPSPPQAAAPRAVALAPPSPSRSPRRVSCPAVSSSASRASSRSRDRPAGRSTPTGCRQSWRSWRMCRAAPCTQLPCSAAGGRFFCPQRRNRAYTSPPPSPAPPILLPTQRMGLPGNDAHGRAGPRGGRLSHWCAPARRRAASRSSSPACLPPVLTLVRLLSSQAWAALSRIRQAPSPTRGRSCMPDSSSG